MPDSRIGGRIKMGLGDLLGAWGAPTGRLWFPWKGSLDQLPGELMERARYWEQWEELKTMDKESQVDIRLIVDDWHPSGRLACLDRMPTSSSEVVCIVSADVVLFPSFLPHTVSCLHLSKERFTWDLGGKVKPWSHALCWKINEGCAVLLWI